MSDEVGGYYAELKLLTDAASFAQGRKQLEDFTKAGEQAIAVFNALQRAVGGVRLGSGGSGAQNERWVGGGPGSFGHKQIGYNQAAMASYGGNSGGQTWRYAGNNFGQNGGGQGRLPPPGGNGVSRIPGGGDAEEGDRGEQKKSALTRMATLYALIKAVQMLERFTKAMWDLTATSSKAIQTVTSSAVMMGMTSDQAKMWTTAITSTAGADAAGEFNSSATNIENAYRNLKKGDSSLFGQIASPLAMLGLDPGAMMDMGNNDRMKKIINALMQRNKSDPKQAVSLSESLGLSGLFSYMTAPNTPGWGADPSASLLGHGTLIGAPTAKDVSNAQDFSKLQTLLDNLSKLLGNTALDAINGTVKEINGWIEKNQGKIDQTFKAISRLFNVLLQATAWLGETTINGLAFAEKNAELTDIGDKIAKLDIAAGKTLYGTSELFTGPDWSRVHTDQAGHMTITFGPGYTAPQMAEIRDNYKKLLDMQAAAQKAASAPPSGRQIGK